MKGIKSILFCVVICAIIQSSWSWGDESDDGDEDDYDSDDYDYNYEDGDEDDDGHELQKRYKTYHRHMKRPSDYRSRPVNRHFQNSRPKKYQKVKGEGLLAYRPIGTRKQNFFANR